MKRTTLTPAQAAWLADTIARNKARFNGWLMEEGAGGDGDTGDGGDGDNGGGTGSGDGGGDGSGTDKGYPDNTRPDDMTPAQQAAYFRAQARKHEDRNKDLLKLTGGKYGDDLKAVFSELEQLRDKGRTESERAVEDAKKETRAEILREFGSKLVAAEFRAALAHVAGERRDQIIEGLNLSHYLTDNGDVDTAKVRSYADTIAPAVKDTGTQRHDFGAGKRGTQSKTGVSTGAEMFAASRKKSTTSDS